MIAISAPPYYVSVNKRPKICNKSTHTSGLLGLGLGLEAKFSGLGLEAFGLGLGLGLVFLALALFKAKVKVTNILPNTSRYNYTNSTLVYQRHWYCHSASPRLLTDLLWIN